MNACTRRTLICFVKLIVLIFLNDCIACMSVLKLSHLIYKLFHRFLNHFTMFIALFIAREQIFNITIVKK